MSNPRDLLVLILLVVAVLLSTTPGYSAETTPWHRDVHFGASITDVSANQVDRYENVTGLSGTEESFAWIANFDANFERTYNGYSQEHRVSMRYGQIDGIESNDEIDLNNIGRVNLGEPLFGYGNLRVRSEFDTFAHPAILNLSTGLGTTLMDSEHYGEIETRTGPRFTREWNPEVDWTNLYELILEYELTIDKANSFTSQLESYTLLDRPETYTVRWDNNLTTTLNSWLDLRYSFTLYYQNSVGEVATQSISTINFIYHFYRRENPEA